jgi:hypothetical protein
LLTVVPEPSFMPQRPMRPGPLVSSWFIVLPISAGVRATFQTRASSSTPLKNPVATPVGVIAVASDGGWLLPVPGPLATAVDASSVPFR